jgi:hypothetical protein
VNDIPNFEDAISSFRQFLSQSGHPTEIVWVFREDVWKRSPTDVLVRYPPSKNNPMLAQKVFAEGRERGLLDVHAIAAMPDKIAATVWFPRTPDEELQGWNRGMKLSIANPLPRAQMVGRFRWVFFWLLPRFRHYQHWEQWVGTRSWAAA